VLTKPFDFANPTDPDEGSLTYLLHRHGQRVSQRDTNALPAAATPVSQARRAGAVERSLNPRAGDDHRHGAREEAFVMRPDGQYNAGELFVDQGDPSSNSNDDNAYDPATSPGSAAERGCATYHAPNGVWDSDRTIWAPTWRFTAE